MLDAMIIGAGPAGASCALWLSRLGLSCIVADGRYAAGGLLNDSPFRNDWIVTQPGVTGPDLAEGIGLALAATGVPLLLGARAASLFRSDGAFEVGFEMPNGTKAFNAAHLVLATGVRPRSGGLVASERVLIGPGAQIAAHDFAGRSVAILGGGDNAFENYHSVRRAGAAEVHIYARSIRAGRVFREGVQVGDLRQGAYEADGVACSVNGRGYDVLLVMYGWEPVAPFAEELGFKRDAKGFLAVDSLSCETSAAGVFGIGEVAARGHPSVVTAMADGIVAAKAIQRRIENPQTVT